MAELLSNILASEQQLITEAAEALPHQFNVCTFSLGYIRQAVYLCLTCAEPRGICSACSIACHTDHEQVELFPKRHFRCDCPTKSLEQACSLHIKEEVDNTENAYGQNFYRGKFCRCGRPYDASKEVEAMIQCLACEDWFHESCLNLRERPQSRKNSPAPATSVSGEALENSCMARNDDDEASVVSLSDLPAPLISEDDYDTFVCRECVMKIWPVRCYAGTEGSMVVMRETTEDPWTILGKPAGDKPDVSADQVSPTEEGIASTSGSNKRSFEGEDSAFPEEVRLKRPRTMDSRSSDDDVIRREKACSVPLRSERVQHLLEKVYAEEPDYTLCAGDVFLTEGWRTRWCRCAKCTPSFDGRPYLLEEEETYEPPEDPDSGFSLEELGMRALQSLPRDRALDGIRAFNEMRDDLMAYLRPFAERGEVVSELDVRNFFRDKEEALHSRRT